jgi:hypothetical protein
VRAAGQGKVGIRHNTRSELSNTKFSNKNKYFKIGKMNVHESRAEKQGVLPATHAILKWH